MPNQLSASRTVPLPESVVWPRFTGKAATDCSSNFVLRMSYFIASSSVLCASCCCRVYRASAGHVAFVASTGHVRRTRSVVENVFCTHFETIKVTLTPSCVGLGWSCSYGDVMFSRMRRKHHHMHNCEMTLPCVFLPASLSAGRWRAFVFGAQVNCCSFCVRKTEFDLRSHWTAFEVVHTFELLVGAGQVRSSRADRPLRGAFGGRVQPNTVTPQSRS